MSCYFSGKRCSACTKRTAKIEISFDFAYTLLMNAYLIFDTRMQDVVSQIL